MERWETIFGRKFDPAAPVNCDDVIEWIDVYVDRELPAPAVALMSHHVAGCKDCRALVQDRTRLKQKVKASVTSVDVPAQLTRRLQAALRKEQ